MLLRLRLSVVDAGDFVLSEKLQMQVCDQKRAALHPRQVSAGCDLDRTGQ